MNDAASTRAVELLVDEAWEGIGQDRYPRALAAASRAVRIAEQLDDPALLVRSLVVEACALREMGDHVGALARHTRVLGMVETPSVRDRIDQGDVAHDVARAYLDWVAAARFVTGIGPRQLFTVLDAADNWLTATGHRAWRAGILHHRAALHRRLGEVDQAIGVAQEALAAYEEGGPGYTHATYRWELGDLLREADRHDEAVPYYQAILDDPGSRGRGRTAALEGLTRCALAAGDLVTARRHAEAAVRQAEQVGDNALSGALATLIATCMAEGDTAAAVDAVATRLEIARRLGGHHELYYAVRDGVDVALERGDRDTAASLLAALDSHAAVLDTDNGNTVLTAEALRRHALLADLTGDPA